MRNTVVRNVEKKFSKYNENLNSAKVSFVLVKCYSLDLLPHSLLGGRDAGSYSWTWDEVVVAMKFTLRKSSF